MSVRAALFGGPRRRAPITVAPPADGTTQSAAGEVATASLPMPPPGDPRSVPAQGGPLGGSMRQPFDYNEALKVLAGSQRKPKLWQYGLAAAADTMARQMNETPTAVANLSAQRTNSGNRLQDALKMITDWRYKDYARQNEADLRAAAPFTIGRDRLSYDPATGEAQNLYHGPQDFELYARQMGLEPGSPEYFKAVEDYVLRSSGPSAFDRNKQLDDYRTGNDASLERLRYGNRVGLEDLRQSHRQGLVNYRNTHRAPSRGGGSSRPTATDGSGNKMEWDGKAWVPAN